MKDTTARNQVEDLESRFNTLNDRVWEISHRVDALVEHLDLEWKYQPRATLIVKKEKKP